MKKSIIVGAALMLGCAPSCQRAGAVTIQLKWVTQAQFAGYYVAKTKVLQGGRP